ncbi:hypothetical protein SteCoe_39420 [Stentor coeruleus]|uniref:Protein kinase domain-containing protein n=1 Tax=Stentor coeruleus TaxID=5963 RepID=A0A1R2AKM7_9CILI|nr:hypothetical protein SteCoe_39420 [Stentor coeruleus]
METYFNQNNITNREIKIIFYNLIKAYNILKKNNIVHNDISPRNILIQSPETVKLCDFEDSFFFDKINGDDLFPVFNPLRRATINYLSPELMAWTKLADKINFIIYNPYKSNIFSLGLCLLNACGIDITNLNIFGSFWNIHIGKLLTVGYDYIVKDSLKQVSYNLLREELQDTIDKKIKEFPYDSLSKTLRKMLEVDMVERASFDKLYRDAKYYMGIFN